MSTGVALSEHRWPTAEFPLCVLDVSVHQLSRHIGIPVLVWEEDGLGEATGFVCGLDSGLVFGLMELTHAVQHLGAKGPTVLIDATDLVERGVALTVSEVLGAVGLSHDQISWVQTEAGVEAARKVLAHFSSRGTRDEG